MFSVRSDIQKWCGDAVSFFFSQFFVWFADKKSLTREVQTDARADAKHIVPFFDAQARSRVDIPNVHAYDYMLLLYFCTTDNKT